ncbi:MAG TPA: helix-turn-helix domain-containing protein [Solirubrobacterales bacterium]|jgi:excisionase family DNA binding protein|nr:helix-turn-helix domain-containing protein [Solirubrobacterales bacterium]
MPELTVDTARRPFFTSETLAVYLQVSDRLIRRWVAEGRLHSYKLDGCRRFDPDDVDAFLAQFRDRRAVA